MTTGRFDTGPLFFAWTFHSRGAGRRSVRGASPDPGGRVARQRRGPPGCKARIAGFSVHPADAVELGVERHVLGGRWVWHDRTLGGRAKRTAKSAPHPDLHSLLP
ncbi:hypothetical protein CJO79_12960 [Ralstonia solanacearum]|nr:hypothetical protein CJO76_12980 [Ralstonia solanacearum]AXV91823.1 hypothetical protein CJO79_12960 [Ralstonia solanacearum]AXW19918.1 hypothetical protein CJO85_13020 [Ralstonia solanacearum]AXW76709.1 hypothetical protein CJO97_12950 [Ralstonia solanacearum]